jgi:PBP1b-binding outer membrane lipoprotein LpoB
MKIIYTEEVLNRMAERDGVASTTKLIVSGETKATEDKLPYVVITIPDEQDGTSTT